MCHEEWTGSGDGAGATRATEMTVAVAGGRMPAHLYEPTGGGSPRRGPCVLVPDIYGTVAFYHEVARRLAAAGHPTALVDIFFREGPLGEVTRDAAFARRATMDEPRAIDDCSAAITALEERGATARAGVIGFCLGGLFAMVLAARRDDLVAVSYYGFPEGIAAPVRVASSRPIDLAGEMKSRLLAFWGDEDHGCDRSTIDRFGEAMAAHGADYEVHVHPGVGHGFLQGLVEERSDSPAARASWQRTLEVLGAELPA